MRKRGESKGREKKERDEKEREEGRKKERKKKKQGGKESASDNYFSLTSSSFLPFFEMCVLIANRGAKKKGKEFR